MLIGLMHVMWFCFYRIVIYGTNTIRVNVTPIIVLLVKEV